MAAYAARRWTAYTAALTAGLDSPGAGPRADRYHVAALAGLPDPVQRYFRLALTDGQPMVQHLGLTQSGRFDLGTGTPRWKPFTATQTFATTPPGFVWDARITLFPGVAVRVVDSYIAGTGLLRPALLGLFDLGTQQGKGEIARGELMRHFAESPWFPTALLPGRGVVWSAVDDRSARASLTDGPLSVSLLFRFGADGLIASIHADARAAQVGKTTLLRPWECRMSDYQTRHGMRVPMMGEALYHTPQGEKPYFRGRIADLSYGFAAVTPV